jgi:hypothetical protein
VLQKPGFGQIWIDVLSGLLSTSSTQVMLKGVAGERIQLKKGLRQGDPLTYVVHTSHVRARLVNLKS